MFECIFWVMIQTSILWYWTWDSTNAGKYHGVILLPEGLIENIPEFYALLQVNPLVSATK
jgi:hypothetical protein